MSEDNVRGIDSAPGARTQARAEAHRLERLSGRVIEELAHHGAVMVDCSGEADRLRVHEAGRAAGRTLERLVRSTMLSERQVLVWDAERGEHPLQSRLDRSRGMNVMSQGGMVRGSAFPGGSAGGPVGEGGARGDGAAERSRWDGSGTGAGTASADDR